MPGGRLTPPATIHRFSCTPSSGAHDLKSHAKNVQNTEYAEILANGDLLINAHWPFREL